MTICGIYKIQNKTNGKFYVGSSDNVERRFSRHKLDLSKNRHDNQHLQNAWNKYGETSFDFALVRGCPKSDLLLEEQKDLDAWIGNDLCYNMRKDARCPTAPGSKRPAWVVKKYADAQRGIPRWTEEQKKQMSIDRRGRIHSEETKQRMYGRKSSYQNIKLTQQSNVGRVWSAEHCSNISIGKRLASKVMNNEERNHIKNGVQKAVVEGRYHKNKVPKKEYETIRGLYLSGSINKRQFAFKYGITPSSMQKLLQRIGV